MRAIKGSLCVLGGLLFLGGCGDATTTPITKEIESVTILTPAQKKYYVTGELQLKANINFDNNTSNDVSEFVTWEFCDSDTNYTKSDYYEVASLYGGLLKGVKNGMDGKDVELPVRVYYRTFSDKLEENITMVALKDFNFTTLADEQNITVGKEYDFNATASFNDGVELNCSKILHNVQWSVTGSATLNSDENSSCATISFTAGEANVTLSIFDENETRTYTIKE